MHKYPEFKLENGWLSCQAFTRHGKPMIDCDGRPSSVLALPMAHARIAEETLPERAEGLISKSQ